MIVAPLVLRFFIRLGSRNARQPLPRKRKKAAKNAVKNVIADRITREAAFTRCFIGGPPECIVPLTTQLNGIVVFLKKVSEPFTLTQKKGS
jgi:hypothetical protein